MRYSDLQNTRFIVVPAQQKQELQVAKANNYPTASILPEAAYFTAAGCPS